MIVEYGNHRAEATETADSANPIYAAHVAESAVRAAGQRAVDMIGGAFDDIRWADDEEIPEKIRWPLGPRPHKGWHR